MGTYSPPPVLTDALIDQAWRELIVPTVEGMAAEGNPYVGVLYAGPDADARQGRSSWNTTPASAIPNARP
jgi:phosphoribosylamine-glycine ligase